MNALLARLGPESEAAAAEYEAIRCRLIEFFDRNGVCTPEPLADESIDRVARRLEAGEAIDRLRPYVHGVARRVLMEWRRNEGRRAAAWAARPEAVLRPDPSTDEAEARHACVEGCLAELPRESRELIRAYYDGAGGSPLDHRKKLAQRLGISYGTLKVRAHRIRVRLEARLRDRLGLGEESGR